MQSWAEPLGTSEGRDKQAIAARSGQREGRGQVWREQMSMGRNLAKGQWVSPDTLSSLLRPAGDESPLEVEASSRARSVGWKYRLVASSGGPGQGVAGLPVEA